MSTFYCGYCNRHKKAELLAKTKPRKQCKACVEVRVKSSKQIGRTHLEESGRIKASSLNLFFSLDAATEF